MAWPQNDAPGSPHTVAFSNYGPASIVWAINCCNRLPLLPTTCYQLFSFDYLLPPTYHLAKSSASSFLLFLLLFLLLSSWRAASSASSFLLFLLLLLLLFIYYYTSERDHMVMRHRLHFVISSFSTTVGSTTVGL